MPQAKASPARRNGRPQAAPEPDLPPPPATAQTWLFLSSPAGLPQPQGEVDRGAVQHWQLQASLLGTSREEWMRTLLKVALHEYLVTYGENKRNALPATTLLLPITGDICASLDFFQRHIGEYAAGYARLGDLVVALLEEFCTPTLTLYCQRLAKKGLSLEQIAKKLHWRDLEHASLPPERQLKIVTRDQVKFHEFVEAQPPALPPQRRTSHGTR